MCRCTVYRGVLSLARRFAGLWRILLYRDFLVMMSGFLSIAAVSRYWYVVLIFPASPSNIPSLVFLPIALVPSSPSAPRLSPSSPHTMTNAVTGKSSAASSDYVLVPFVDSMNHVTSAKTELSFSPVSGDLSVSVNRRVTCTRVECFPTKSKALADP